MLRRGGGVCLLVPLEPIYQYRSNRTRTHTLFCFVSNPTLSGQAQVGLLKYNLSFCIVKTSSTLHWMDTIKTVPLDVNCLPGWKIFI